ncbi:MAG: 6-carboxytetrahydropterin synthase [Chloroflexi bacterium]|nr:6-carboxytetrahydropterin synthase [Chloroflexota bacterium]
MMETIRVLSDFHTAHRQLGYPGKCAFVHGHTWKGEFTVSTETFPRDHLDMALDFGDLKQIMRHLDHKIIVTESDAAFIDEGTFEPEGVVVIRGRGPSVENVASYCFEKIVEHIRQKFPDRGLNYRIQVTIEETDHNFFIVEHTVRV